MSVALDRAPRAGHRTVRALDWVARWTTVYSDAAARIARTLVIVSVVICGGAVAVNVFTRHVLGFSITGWDELASFAFLWTIWMGVSLAVRRGEVTVMTFVRDRGPRWWRQSVRTFSGLSLAALLVYCVIRSTEYAVSREARIGGTTLLSLPWFYGVVSMTLGYYFIALHYFAAGARGAARLAARGRVSVRESAVALLGALAIATAVWTVVKLVLVSGGSPLIALGVVFVALTFAGNPIIFMLSIVGILAVTGVAGLSFYPSPDVLAPFRATQTTMGLSQYSELTVVLMFLVVAEVMNMSGMSDRLIRFAAAIVGHVRGGMAYVCQVTSALVSGISGSAQADAAVMTPLLVPAMEKEGYPKDVAAAVVAGASIKGPIGPISVMFIVYGIAANTSIRDLLLSGVTAELLLFVFQAATVYLVVRRLGFFQKRPFAGTRTVVRTGVAALPIVLIPVIILGGILRGVFTPSESGAAAAAVALLLAMFWYGSLSIRDLPRALVRAGVETGVVLLLVGDSAILATTLQNNGFGEDLSNFLTGLTDNKYVFLLAINVLLLLIGIFIEPLPAVWIFAPFLAPVAAQFGVNPTHFGLIVVFNLVIALIHPPIGLVLFLVSGLSKVSVERLSIVIIPWLVVSLFVLFLVTYLPTEAVLVFVNHPGETLAVGAGLMATAILAAVGYRSIRRAR